MSLPINCPRCRSTRTVHIQEVDTSTCLDCDLDWWWSPDDQQLVTSEETE